ncbi:MAG: ead/Ea22-like family protein [Pseudomonas sp.]|uniref:ead/Ea22-like family protein n=1 Tax=Pseudomonas TaxID=286 RepID=UPI000BD43C57|nr:MULTISPECIES: ead/Ea22-like family protein [Pseudomonas]MDN5390720.1 ead/Ea22-like family protein [Pseudomonas sp.]MDN5405308.1 ead/Ea22-like family protein [Pseudomonas sp.]MDN5452958.1 ead/Ea22-like family protein [Pseudomonas sp.]MDN5456840.1 ead/Ea22-like family protein [Pseudomonas sp.]MDN5670806.1 ead/Ea22-like family protein [Pseudomonas sp.]
MADHADLKKLAEDAVIFAGINGEISYAQEQFIAAANPAAVLVLLDELESAQKKIDQAWNRSTPALDGYIPGAMDAWKRPVKQHLPYDFSGNPGDSAIQYCNGWNDSGGYWKSHCSDLQAQIDGLKTGFEAYEQVNAGLKAEVARSTEREILQLAEIESLRKDAERYRWLRIADWWRSPVCVIRNPKEQAKLGSDCPSGDRLDAAIDAAMGKGEQS